MIMPLFLKVIFYICWILIAPLKLVVAVQSETLGSAFALTFLKKTNITEFHLGYETCSAMDTTSLGFLLAFFAHL
jgi:hypothetical protein